MAFSPAARYNGTIKNEKERNTMKETIYTIPLMDAFNANDECPFCFIERKLEQEAVAFIMGPAYMEDDIREETDRLGFCRHHFKMLYDYGNKLGCALMLHTYYQKLNKDMHQQFAAFTPKKSGAFARLKKSSGFADRESSLGQWVAAREQTCYVCNHFKEKYPRYIDTFFQLLTHNDEFFHTFEQGKGFCLHHFGDIIEAAEKTLSSKEKEKIYPVLFNRMEENMKRLEDDISWFVDKYDYRNRDADWKTSKDAIQRGMQKLAGGYPDDPVFTKL